MWLHGPSGTDGQRAFSSSFHAFPLCIKASCRLSRVAFPFSHLPSASSRSPSPPPSSSFDCLVRDERWLNRRDLLTTEANEAQAHRSFPVPSPSDPLTIGIGLRVS